jgi:hypothetical protein
MIENSTRFKPIGESPLADRPVSVHLPLDLDAYVRSRPDRADWLRKAIAAAVKKEAKKR